MNELDERALEERVLVLPPTSGDAALSRSLLAEAGMRCHVCTDLGELCRAFAEGAGAVLLTEEVLGASDSDCLVDTLRRQPDWSDVPVLLLTGSGADSPVAVAALELLGNVTLLERPVRLTVLVSALRSALKARRRQYELRHRLEELREAGRRKDEFLAMLAHELRNPLAPIRSAVDILRLRGAPDPVRQRSWDVIDRQVQHMARLLDDLLDVSRITHNKLELRRERLALAEVVQTAVETSSPLLAAARHELTVALPPEPVLLDADPVRLAQVFSNLLNNAAKYTNQGGHIRLSAERHDSEVVVAVKDDGIGISAAMLPRVFDIFAQESSARGRSQGGVGIGLSLVKGLVELHGGSITARSDGPGQGSEFVVRLPVVAGLPASVPPPPAEKASPPCVGKCRVLVVDDLEANAETLGELLEVMGNEVRTAYGGAAAVQAAGEFRPQVVLLDIGMPDVDGYEAARRLRQQPWGKEMLLVALTGWAGEEDRRKTREAGFDQHLVKPVGAAALAQLLAGLPREEA